jgi:putative transposase
MKARFTDERIIHCLTAHANNCRAVDGPNQRWSLDFVSDALTDGCRFRILAVVDDFSRENLVLVADTSLSGLRVTRELDRVIAERGMPTTIVSDKGTEFTSMAILQWVQKAGIDWHYIGQAPAKWFHRKLQRQAER